MSADEPPTRREFDQLTTALRELGAELRADRTTYVSTEVFLLTIKSVTDAHEAAIAPITKELEAHDKLLDWMVKGALGFLMAAVVGVAIYVLLSGGPK